MYGGTERLQEDPAWRDNLLFHEYFHGDNGAGLGAMHQTGWTALVVDLILDPPSRGTPVVGRDRRHNVHPSTHQEAPPVTLKHPRAPQGRTNDLVTAPLFSLETGTIPRDRIPEGELPADVAYQIVHDELMLDGNARLNLATFVTTWMEPQAEQLMAECFDKNMIDKDEYPQTAELEMRCVQHARRLWHAPDADAGDRLLDDRVERGGMLGGLALKRRWQQRAGGRGQAGRPAEPRHGHQRPGLLGEVRQLLGRRDAPRADGGRPVPPLGRGGRRSAATRTRSASSRSSARRSTAPTSPSRRSAPRSTRSRQRTGLDVPVHVDGASGAMVAPFLDPDLEWDFRLPRVASINTSGPQVRPRLPRRRLGRLARRRRAARGPDLLGQLPRRQHADVRAQLLPPRRARSSRSTTTSSASASTATAACRATRATWPRSSRRAIAELGPFELLTSGDELPVFAFTLNDDVDNFTVFDVSDALRERGWQVPAYTFPENRTDLAALRVVVRRGFTHDMAEMLVRDIERQLPRLQRSRRPQHDAETGAAFAH